MSVKQVEWNAAEEVRGNIHKWYSAPWSGPLTSRFLCLFSFLSIFWNLFIGIVVAWNACVRWLHIKRFLRFRWCDEMGARWRWCQDAPSHALDEYWGGAAVPFVVIMPIASVILIIKFMRVNSIGREAFIMRTRILTLVQERSITGICDGSGNPACNLAHGVLLRFDRRREWGRNNIAFFSFIAKGAGIGGGGGREGGKGDTKSRIIFMN